ncbi:MAG: polysaccharide export outer membrane protein [Flavobacteriales bacterium]|jgi:polysaccharide export outer membrane protein
MKKLIFIFFTLTMICACSSKRNMIYVNGIEKYPITKISKQKKSPLIQENDILRIEVRSMFPKAAIVYNRISERISQNQNIELLQLEGYLVSDSFTINFPVLGSVKVEGTTLELEKKITKLLLDGEHLVNPSVSVRLLNGKFTVIGEVVKPGTYNYLDKHINLFQALGYAGDLTISGKRKNISLIREMNGIRTTTKLDITSIDFLDNPAYYIRNNDIIIVHPNYNRIKSAGFIGSPQSIASISSLLLSITLLILNK